MDLNRVSKVANASEHPKHCSILNYIHLCNVMNLGSKPKNALAKYTRTFRISLCDIHTHILYVYVCLYARYEVMAAEGAGTAVWHLLIYPLWCTCIFLSLLLLCALHIRTYNQTNIWASSSFFFYSISL